MKTVTAKLLLLTALTGLAAWIVWSGKKMQVPGPRPRQSGIAGQMESWWQARAYPDPTYLNDKWWAAWQHELALRSADISESRRSREQSRSNYGSWMSLGPNNGPGGRIISIAINPSNPNIVFAGSASGGMWKSINGGGNWSYVQMSLPVLGVSSIIISSTDPNTMYAGTGEVYRADSSNFGYSVWKARGTYGIGIIKSTNGGASWTQVLTRSASMLFGVQRLKFSPAGDNTIFACATDGLYRSTDAGSTWTNIAPGKIYVSDVVINTADPDQLLIAVGNLTNTNKGILRTVNGTSATPAWTKVTTGLPSNFNGFGRFAYLSGNTVFASLSHRSGNELYRSANFGSSWNVLNNSGFTSYQFWCTNAIAINPSNPNSLILGGVNLYRYNVSGQSRSGIGGSVHDDMHDIRFDPTNSNIFYVATDGGVYKTTNGGSNFSAMNNGLGATQFYASLGVSSTTPDLFLGGLQDNGAWRYNGSGWTRMGWMGGDGTTCAIQPGNNNVMIACRDARGIYRSTSGGSGGSQVADYWGFIGDSRTAFVAPLAFSKSNPNIAYCATDVLHKSTNGGASWSGNSLGSTPPYPAVTPNNFIERRHKTALALAVSPTDPDKVYVSTSPFAQYDNDVSNLYVNVPPGVYKTTTGAVPFTNIKSNLPDRFVMDFAISPGNDDTVMVALGGYGTSHIWLTGNGGATWVDRGAGLPDVPFNAIVFDPELPNFVYAGSDLGVYVSNDRGYTWYSYSFGFTDAVQIFDLQITADDRLVAATHGKGVWITDLARGVLLPVHILQFSGTRKNKYNALQWQVNEENNVSYYELERKVDNSSFVYRARINAVNSSSIAAYSYHDDISNVTGNNFYYRLKVVHRDGSVSHSVVVLLERPGNANMEILGNPVTSASSIRLTLPAPQPVTLKLYDSKGKLIRIKLVHAASGPNTWSFNLFGMIPSGHYIVEAITPAERFSKRIVKK